MKTVEAKYSVELYTRHSSETHRFPENSYDFETSKELAKCLMDLIDNKMAGIYACNIRFNGVK